MNYFILPVEGNIYELKEFRNEDELVYRLYGITEEEKKIIEDSLK